MVTEISCLTGNFDLYCVFVELTFGSLLSVFIAILGIIFLIGALTKTSPTTIILLMLSFSAIYLTMWFGGIWAAFIFFISLIWFWFGIHNYLKSRSAG